jgi:hypothetical protein
MIYFALKPLKTIKNGWRRLETVEDGRRRLGTVWDGLGRLRTGDGGGTVGGRERWETGTGAEGTGTRQESELLL